MNRSSQYVFFTPAARNSIYTSWMGLIKTSGNDMIIVPTVYADISKLD